MAENHLHPTIPTLIVLAFIATGVSGTYILDQNEHENSTLNQVDSPSTTSLENPPSETTIKRYKDDTYSAQGTYSTPGGTESISVTLTLTDGKIIDVDAKGSARGGNSAQFQGQFLASYEKQVVGKSIDEVHLSKVAGSSLTSNGFNRALDRIKNDARS